MVLRNKIVILASVALTACANNTVFWNPPPQGMAENDLNYYKWNCNSAADQAAFLKAQLATTTPFPVDETRRAIIYKNINEMKMACPPPALKPAGCVNVREDMAHGSGQATVCNLGPLRPLERPVVNKWEAVVDH
jgi:hypothetical protein